MGFQELDRARSRHRLYRDPMELARSDGAHRHEEWQACRRRSACLYNPAGVLGPRRYFRGYAQALRHPRKLLLWLYRDDGPRHGAGWSLRSEEHTSELQSPM